MANSISTGVSNASSLKEINSFNNLFNGNISQFNNGANVKIRGPWMSIPIVILSDPGSKVDTKLSNVSSFSACWIDACTKYSVSRIGSNSEGLPILTAQKSICVFLRNSFIDPNGGLIFG